MTGILITLGLGFALAFAESGIGLGMVIPGETAVVVLAAATPSGPQTVALFLVVALGACAGDHVGYVLGRRYGDRLRDSKPVRRLGQQHFDRATDMLRRRGAAAVLLTRLVPIVRTLTPAAAGVSGLRYRRFLPASLAGSLTWSGAYVGGGALFGVVTAFSHDVLGRAAWLVLVVLVVAALPALVTRQFAGVRREGAEPELATLEASMHAGREPVGLVAR